jgi:hypothetical protein
MLVFLEYFPEIEKRGREDFHVADFDIPEANEVNLILNTTAMNEEQCLSQIINTYKQYV